MAPLTVPATPSNCRLSRARCAAWWKPNAREKRAGRAAGIAAARDRFYKGDIAREMVAFLRQHDAPFDESDFADYFARIEEPAHTTYRGYTIYKHGFSSQGPTLLQALNILENFDLHAMGYGSADYLHTVTEALKLAYADRDTYYADQAFVNRPPKACCRKPTRKERAALIDPKRASKAFIAGDPMKYDSQVKTWPYWKASVPENSPRASSSREDQLASLGRDSAGISKDTTHMSVIDKDGNRLRRDAQRRLDYRRRDPRRHRHRHERPRRTVLAG